MTLLFVLTRYPGYGGIENVTTQIISHLNATGNYKCIIVSYLKGNTTPLKDIQVYNMPEDTLGESKINAKFIEQKILENKVDAIIYQDSYAPTHRQVLDVATTYNIPVYVFEHNSPVDTIANLNVDKVRSVQDFLRKITTTHRKNRVIERKRFLLRHCKRYVLLSPRFEQEFKDLVKMPDYENKITSISNPLNIDPIDKALDKMNIVLFVGRIEQVKRLDLCLDCWKEFVKKCPDWKFIIVGDGSQRSALESKVREEDITNVEFKGFDKPLKYYQNSKLFWMTSDYEGWGLTLVEAMSQGCVCVVRDSFAAVHDIITSENGIVVARNDLSTFISKSIEIAENPQLFTKLSSASISTSRQYLPEIIIESWKKLLSDE